MSFFGLGKKKLDEQSREEQSAETAKVQKEQVSEDAPKSARLSQKIMEQQQWEDSLRRFVKSESARHQNHDEEQNEEHRAIEDLKRALLHGDEKVEESSATDELTEDQAEEQERRSLLATLGAFPQESEEPVKAEQVDQAQDVEEDDAPVAEFAQPATPVFLRDDEESAAEDASVEAQEPKDAAEDARSQFEEHLRALRAQKTKDAAVEDAEDTAGEAEGREELEIVEAVVEASENKSENAHSVSESAVEEASADTEDSLTVEDMNAARTRAAVTEAQNAGLDNLAATYAARLGITLNSEEETFGEVASDEVAAEDADSAEAAEVTEATEVEDFVAETTDSAEDEPAKSSSVAPALAAVAAAAVVSAAKAEKAEEKTEKDTSQSVALTAEGIDKKEAEKRKSATREESAEEPVAELKDTAQKLSEDEAELVAESIILSEPLEGAATLPALPEPRALYSLAELMRTRGSGTMSLELRQVNEDMHYRLLHRGREVETGIVVPGVDWFAPVAALYTEAQQAGATWNRVAVSLKPRLGDGLEVHASYLSAVDGQTISESFLLEGAAVEAKPVAIAEATSQDEPQEDAVQNVDSVEAELAEKQAANEAEATAEVTEEPVIETAEEDASAGLLTAAGLAAAGTAVVGSAAYAQEKDDVEEAIEAFDEPAQPATQPAQTEFAPVEAEFEHDYENDPVFGAATVESETEKAEESVAEATEVSAEGSDEPDEDMEAALAAIVANAHKKLDAEEVLAAEEQKAAAPVVAESFTLDRTQPVEEAAEEPVAESAEEPALPAFLDDSKLLAEKEASVASAEASPEEPALVDVEPAAESASVAPGLAGALAAATTPVVLPESTPAGISSSISASALSELNQLPTIVAEPDTPSATLQSPLVPSETQLATGNLVLTEAQVAQRLAPVVEHLFGENGTAKDATTVLIRVRALGSYYDALTHVRRNGFWEQVRTFELIPETLLDIPALKTDSYSEGEGSPLAMSLTFTPGVPVQAAFDYANEQAFVTYPRPLDAERYVEELRMFPRLGSKIPAHMTSALSHWNL
ncbi:ornithinee aminotransferase [uncultured Rothia sp.]|uniref:ornithinee aminotransferase n=1 Tax=uncultured Rothia sp. TaxID=316088 RepID=UPI0026177C58|nr:ornithinee aminotransferase [uncultured Rothia sp.]